MQAKPITPALLLALGLSAPFTSAAFERDHAAHEHGHALLMVVQEGDELELVLESPAINIVGFEHKAESEQDRQLLQEAQRKLKDGARLFRANDEAGCTLEHANVESALLDGLEADADDHEGHDKAHDEDHDGEDHEDQHADFRATWHFSCQNIAKLKQLDVKLLGEFPNMEEIEAQVLTENLQTLYELDESNARVDF